MLRFLADEDFNNRIVRGLLRRQPDLDVIRVQDTPLAGTSDPTILDWATRNNRIPLTHDVSTMTGHAFERTRSGGSLVGIIEVPQSASIGQIIEDILLIAATCTPEEFENRIEYLPL